MRAALAATGSPSWGVYAGYALALAVGLVWSGLGGGMHPGVLAAAAVGLAALLYYNRSIGRLAAAFYGVRDAVAGKP